MTVGMQSLLVNASQLVAARILGILIRGAYIIVLARELGAELYGTYAFGLAWYLALLPLATLGMAQMLGVEIGRSRERAAQFTAVALGLRIASSIILGLISGVISWAWLGNTQIFFALALFSLALAGRNLAIWAEQVLVGMERSVLVLRQEALFRPLEGAIGIILLLLSQDLLAIVALHAGIWCLQALMGLSLVTRTFGSVTPGWDSMTVQRLLRNAMLVVPTTFCIGWVFQGPIVIFRALSVNPAEVGNLALALQIFSLLQFLPISLMAAALPILGRSTQHGENSDLRFLSFGLRATVIGGTALLLCIFMFGDFLVYSILTPGYAGITQLFALGSVAFSLFSGIVLVTDVLLIRGHKMEVTTAALTGTLSMTAVIWLASPFGSPGVILGLVVGQTGWLASLLIILKYTTNVQIISSITPAFIAAGTALGAFALIPAQASVAAAISLIVLALSAILLSALMFGD